MDESITDQSAVTDAGAEEALPATQQDDSAASTTDEPTSTNEQGDSAAQDDAGAGNGTKGDQGEDASLPSSDDAALKKWAEDHGLTLDSESATKAAKIAMDNQADFHRQRQQEAASEKFTPPEQPETDNPAIQALQQQLAQESLARYAESWKSRKGLTEAQAKEFANYFAEHPEKEQLITGGHLSLDEVYSLSGIGAADPAAIKAKGEQEGLQKLANKQQATAVRGNASNSAPSEGLSKANVDSWWDSLGSEGRSKPENRVKLDSILGT